jgi:hypothetical protein
MWMLFSGVYGFGYSFYVYNRLLTAVVDAAALGAKLDYDTSDPAAYSTALQNMVLYGDTVAGTAVVVPGLTATQVVVTVSLDSASIPRDVTIAIRGYSINAISFRIPLTDKPGATMRFSGKVVCSRC